MTESKTARPDETVLGGESSVPDTAGAAAGGAEENKGAPVDQDSTKPPER